MAKNSKSKAIGKKIGNMVSYTEKHKGHFPFHESRRIQKDHPKEYDSFANARMKKKGKIFDY